MRWNRFVFEETMNKIQYIGIQNSQSQSQKYKTKQNNQFNTGPSQGTTLTKWTHYTSTEERSSEPLIPFKDLLKRRATTTNTSKSTKHTKNHRQCCGQQSITEKDMSAQDAQMLESELRTLIDKTSTTLNNIMSLPFESRLDTYEKLQKDMKKINSLYHDLTVEVRLLEVAADQRIYDVKAQEHNLKIKKLKEEMSKKRSEINAQPTTTTGASGGGGGGGGGSGMNTNRNTNEAQDNRNPATREAHNTKDRILQTQNKTINTLDDAERTLLATEDTAADATAKLQAQTDQMRKINDDLDQLDSEVERAKKELNAFIRRMMTDKILICFAILVLLGIILIVVFNFVIKKKDGGSADDVVVTTPAPTLPTTTFVP